MAAQRASGRASQLWQFPLFIVSIALFGVAAYLFIQPGPRATIDQKIDVAIAYLKQDRPDAAREQLNKLLDSQKLPKEREAQVHLLLAQSLADGQKQQKIDIPANHQRIIEQTELAVELRAKPNATDEKRVADSYAALGQTASAVTHYLDAIALDPAHSLHLRRKVIELQLDNGDSASADLSLDEYLKSKELTDAERAWALDQRAGILIDQKKFAEARKLLADATRLDSDPVDQGQFNYQLGYCSYREGQNDDAERYLRLSRDQLRISHPLDADAALLLGRIYQQRGDAPTAVSFYQDILTSHPDAKIAPLALLGRGECRIMQKETDAGLTDLHDLTNEILSKTSREKFKSDAVSGFENAGQVLSDREEFSAALEVMTDEQTLNPTPGAEFFGRLGRLYEKRAKQLEATIPDAVAAEKIRRTQEVRDLRNHAADSYIIYSRALTLTDDKGYADAMWKGIDLYDQSGNLQRVITSLELFVAERPDDRLAPDALLRLGKAYQTAGLFDKAIDAYQRNQFRYPNSLAASKSAVPLAQAYIAKGPTYYARAEKTLLGVVENNPLVDPSAEEFRQSLIELAQLYYRTGRYEDAIGRFHELTERYPNDQQKPQMVFLMADSYRKSAQLLETGDATAMTGAQPAGATLGVETGAATQPTASTQPSPAEKAEAAVARRDRLTKSRALFDQAIDLYRTDGASSDIDKLYQKLAYFYRADCMYDLGQYQDAIKLYDQAAFAYQNDPSALAAYVQIVNAYCALGKPDEAKAANNRAKWMLKHMPADAFADGSFSMPRKYWDQWLQWTNDSGMW